MIKSKTESPTTRLKTLLLKLSEYTIDLKYQKGSEMHTSDALSRLQNIADTPDNRDIIPLNFLQHLTPNYIKHAYSHLVENLYFPKTKSLDTTQVKRKHGRPPKVKQENPNSNPNLQRMSEKHLDFEIQAVNTIRPPDIEYTKTSQPLVPVDTPLLVIRKHILRQSDINKIVKSIETRVIHRLELLIQAQDLIKAYQTSKYF